MSHPWNLYAQFLVDCMLSQCFSCRFSFLQFFLKLVISCAWFGASLLVMKGWLASSFTSHACVATTCVDCPIFKIMIFLCEHNVHIVVTCCYQSMNPSGNNWMFTFICFLSSRCLFSQLALLLQSLPPVHFCSTLCTSKSKISAVVSMACNVFFLFVVARSMHHARRLLFNPWCADASQFYYSRVSLRMQLESYAQFVTNEGTYQFCVVFILPTSSIKLETQNEPTRRPRWKPPRGIDRLCLTFFCHSGTLPDWSSIFPNFFITLTNSKKLVWSYVFLRLTWERSNLRHDVWQSRFSPKQIAYVQRFLLSVWTFFCIVYRLESTLGDFFTATKVCRIFGKKSLSCCWMSSKWSEQLHWWSGCRAWWIPHRAALWNVAH